MFEKPLNINEMSAIKLISYIYKYKYIFVFMFNLKLMILRLLCRQYIPCMFAQGKLTC